MKKSILLLAAIGLLAFTVKNSVNSSEINSIDKPEYTSYGEKITADGAIDMTTLLKKLGKKESLECKVIGEITGTCVKKGCWMTVVNPDGEDMRVTFKDYGFFVPVSDQEGKTVIMNGVASIETTTVDMLRHYAEDAGKSEKEIMAITEPETNFAFVANGVLIKD